MSDTSAKPLLILDLDETLVYGSEDELDRPADFRVGHFHVYCRPHLTSFFDGVAGHYDLAVWSSASASYVSAIAQQLASDDIEWRFVWSRERCVRRRDLELFRTFHIKDLRKVKRLGYALKRVLIIDDSRHKVARNFGNAIYVSPFEGDVNDTELVQLRAYLLSLRDEPNFRTIEKRRWWTGRP